MGSVSNILHHRLNFRKVSVDSSNPSKGSKANSSKNLQGAPLLNKDPDAFLLSIVAQDKTWVHHFDPELKSQSLQWKHSSSPPPRKFKVVPSSGMVMTSVFWDCEGIIYIDYLQKGQGSDHHCRALCIPASTAPQGNCTETHNLAPSDFFLFPRLKYELLGRFPDDSGMISAVKTSLGLVQNSGTKPDFGCCYQDGENVF